jgi:hypothetical protein
MKIGRRYILPIPPATVAAAQDLAQFNGAAGKVYRIISQSIGCTDTTIATGQMLSLRARYLPATVTNGSGGTGSLTPSAVDPGDAACSSAGNLINSTTKAITGGTAVILFEGSCHLYQGHYKNYENEDACPILIPSTAFVFELLSTVSGTVNLSGELVVEEIG